MSKLYATNFANVDYNQVETEYGSPVIILTSGFIDLSNERGKKNLYDKVVPIIQAASPEDLVIMSGSSVLSAIIVHYWLKIHGSIRMLAFNRRINGGSYSAIIFNNVELSSNDGGD